jgi:hypothetical protein
VLAGVFLVAWVREGAGADRSDRSADAAAPREPNT